MSFNAPYFKPTVQSQSATLRKCHNLSFNAPYFKPALRHVVMRGFIAAPLLGTIIFVSAILFVTHMTQMEKMQVASIVRDTYHNTIVSTLENYRSDLGSLFAVSVGKAIEKYLNSQCWTVFTITNHPGIGMGALEIKRKTYGIAPNGFQQVNAEGNYDNSREFNYDKMQVQNALGQTYFSSTSPFAKEQDNNQLDYHELRYHQCAEVLNVMRGAVCPNDPKHGVTAWLSATRGGYNFRGINFDVANDDLVKQFNENYECDFGNYVITNSRYFKATGTFTPAGKPECNGNDAMSSEYECKCIDGPNANCRSTDSTTHAGQSCSGITGTFKQGKGQDMCERLVGASLFDCKNFAENLAQPFRCCSQFVQKEKLDSPGNYKYAGNCCDKDTITALGNIDRKACSPDGVTQPDANGYVVPGCESGTFYLKLNVMSDDELYKALPRVSAADQSGNQLEANAIGSQNFNVHIKYPLFKYYDAAFKMYAAVAYGTGGSTNPKDDFFKPTVNMRKQIGGAQTQNDNEGIIEGWALGPAGSGKITPTRLQAGMALTSAVYNNWYGFKRNNPHAVTAANAMQIAQQTFFDAFFNPVKQTSICRLVKPALGGGYCNENPDANLCQTQIQLSSPGSGYAPLCGLKPATGVYDEPSPAPSAADPAGTENKLSALFFGSTSPFTPDKCDPTGPDVYCAKLQSLAYDVKLLDYDPTFLTSTDGTNTPDTFPNNTFCFSISPQHANPEVTPGI